MESFFENFQEIAGFWPEKRAQKSKEYWVLATDPPQGSFFPQIKAAIR